MELWQLDCKVRGRVSGISASLSTDVSFFLRRSYECASEASASVSAKREESAERALMSRGLLFSFARSTIF